MKEWEDLDKDSRDIMNSLGCFEPSDHEKDMIVGVKGDWENFCDVVYLGSEELRKIARACEEVAQWLDEREA